MPSLDFFLSDWSKVQSLETRWPSDVASSFLTDSEDRRSLTTKPRRSVSVAWAGLTNNLSSRILLQALVSMRESVEVPLYSDQSEVTAVAGVSVTCNTVDRRFFAGFKIVIVSADQKTVERGTIASLTPTSLTLAVALTGTYPLGSLVFPIMDAEPLLSHSATYETDELITLEATFKEKTGPTALPALLPTFGAAPPGFPLISGLPVLNLKHNWKNKFLLELGRTGSSFAQGKGSQVVISGTRPIQVFGLEFSPLTRAESLSFLRFFDSRRGRCLPFWLVPPHTVFTATQAVGPNVTISAVQNLGDLTAFVGWVAIEETDGTLHIQPLGSVSTVNASEWLLTPTVAFPTIPIADIARVTTGHLVRFSSDSLEEQWTTEEVGSFVFSVTELVSEQTVEVTNL